MPNLEMDGSVNQHYLNKVMDLAEVMPVVRDGLTRPA